MTCQRLKMLHMRGRSVLSCDLRMPGLTGTLEQVKSRTSGGFFCYDDGVCNAANSGVESMKKGQLITWIKPFSIDEIAGTGPADLRKRGITVAMI